MIKHIDPCETARVRVLAAALALQQCTKTAANIIPIPGREPKRFIAIGTKAEVARLLELDTVAAGNTTPDHLEPDPIEQLVDVIELGAQPEHCADLADSEGGDHD